MIADIDATTLAFPVADYLDQYLPSHFAQATQSELSGQCLFHDDHNPSLYVNVDTGMYYCHACHARGNVVRLVQRVGQFLSYPDAEQWLLSHYGPNSDATYQPFTLRFQQRIDVGTPDYADETVAQQYVTDDNPYMTVERGIPLSVLRQFDIGYCASSNSVTIPWRDSRGQLLTVKHRSIYGKKFWYEPRCTALRQHLWGLHRARLYETVYIVEAEIDALTLWTAGKPSVAIGGSSISEEQARSLVMTGVQTVVLTCDRDTAGRDANRLIRDRLKHTGITVCEAQWPNWFDGKDCNNLGVDGCRQLDYVIPKLFTV